MENNIYLLVLIETVGEHLESVNMNRLTANSMYDAVLAFHNRDLFTRLFSYSQQHPDRQEEGWSSDFAALVYFDQVTDARFRPIVEDSIYAYQLNYLQPVGDSEEDNAEISTWFDRWFTTGLCPATAKMMSAVITEVRQDGSTKTVPDLSIRKPHARR